MARAKKRRSRSRKRKTPGGTTWRRHFGNTAKACFREGPTSGKAFGACMKANL
jgi:hypothetical protein